MHDTQLDDLLASAITPLPEHTARTAMRLAESTAPRRRMRRRWVVPTIVVGAIVLTGGAGATAATMSHWAGVSMPLDNIRNEVPIPLDWVTDDGEHQHCRGWIEIRNPQPGDRDKLDAAVRAHDWSGFGQKVYDWHGSTFAEEPLGEFAADVFPGIVIGDGPAGVRGVDVTGWTCVPESR